MTTKNKTKNETFINRTNIKSERVMVKTIKKYMETKKECGFLNNCGVHNKCVHKQNPEKICSIKSCPKMQ